MVGKMIGALCILLSCGGTGFYIAYKQLYEIKILEQWIRILDRMEKEIRYQLKSIPDVFRQLSAEEKGNLGRMMQRVAIELENQVRPDVYTCICAVLSATDGIPSSVMHLIEQLGREMGRYDLDGQLQGIARIRSIAEEKRTVLNRDKSKRIRGYQTLGICAGAGLVILFI